MASFVVAIISSIYNLALGDGEEVAAIVEATSAAAIFMGRHSIYWSNRPLYTTRHGHIYQTFANMTKHSCDDTPGGTLFMDFDRTLCTTKTGSSPLNGRHALDPELMGLACSHPNVHVVTRNCNTAAG